MFIFMSRHRLSPRLLKDSSRPTSVACLQQRGRPQQKLSAADPHRAGVSWRKQAWWRERRPTLGERVCKRNLWKLLFILKFFLMMWEPSDNHFSWCHGITIKSGDPERCGLGGGGEAYARVKEWSCMVNVNIQLSEIKLIFDFKFRN